MEKSRMEAFSDGVIAIIITIMVLELRPPEGTGIEALASLAPVFGIYVISFITLGIYWNNHHHMMQAAKSTTGPILWANLHLLFWLSLIPFGARWAGERWGEAQPAAVYSFILLMGSFAFTILSVMIMRHDGPGSVLYQARKRDWKGPASVLCYAAAIPLAFVHPLIAWGLNLVVGAIWFLPDRRIERALGSSGQA